MNGFFYARFHLKAFREENMTADEMLEFTDSSRFAAITWGNSC